MTFGRPSMISRTTAEKVPYPLIVDDAYLHDNPQIPVAQPAGTPSLMAFFVKSLELYDIVANSLSKLYSENDAYTQKSHGSQQSEMLDLTSVLHIDRSLMQWAQDLPPHLSVFSDATASDPIIQRQAIICKIR